MSHLYDSSIYYSLTPPRVAIWLMKTAPVVRKGVVVLCGSVVYTCTGESSQDESYLVGDGRVPEAWLPVGTWLLDGEHVDDGTGLVSDGKSDQTGISVEVTPCVFDNVNSVSGDRSRVGGEVLCAESVSFCVHEGNGEDISGDGTSDLNIVVRSLGHSVVVGGLLKEDTF